ncbi:MAG: 7-cyano-7-deazaguanine synthase [Gammaproteobacteria bacterium]
MQTNLISDSSNHPEVKILWTGGWDSTFRLLDLVLVHRVPVQPYYVIDTGRPSSLQEIAAIHRIRTSIAELSEASAALIKPSIIVSIHDIQKDDDITEKYRRLKEQANLGEQYDWLARLVKQNKISGVELCIHIDDKAYMFVKDHVEIVRPQNDQEYWVLKRDEAKSELSIFGFYRFPLLKLSKVEMQEMALKKGFLHIMEQTWFCFNPKNNKPCGVCKPCKYAIEERMGYRIPPLSRIRYYLYRSVVRPKLLPGRVIRGFSNKNGV